MEISLSAVLFYFVENERSLPDLQEKWRKPPPAKEYGGRILMRTSGCKADHHVDV